MSLALPDFVLTVLLTSPCVTADWSDPNASAVVWTLDAAVLENRPERLSVLGAPVAAKLAGVGALAFDGIDDAFLAECNPAAGASAFTVEMLIAPDVGGPEEQRFLHIQDEAGRRLLLELRMLTAETWALDTFIFEDAANRCTLFDETKFHPAGRWHWVALRYDGTTMSHFVNGIAEGEGAVAMKPMVAGKTSIGVRQNQVSWYKGLIREVRFHGTAVEPDALQRR